LACRRLICASCAAHRNWALTYTEEGGQIALSAAPGREDTVCFSVADTGIGIPGEYLHMLPIRVDDETAARAWSDILHIARSYGLSAYDASYLELTIRLGLPLASLDDQLKATAASAGVAEYKP
jgi:hypothetical protein